MKYELPDPEWVELQKRWEVPNVEVTLDEGESLIEKAVKITCAAIEASPSPSGMGKLNSRVDEDLVTDEDIVTIRNDAKTGRIAIDYWKGRPVKLTLRLTEVDMSINLNSWADRWDMNDTNTIPAIAVTALEQVLIVAST